MHVNVGGAQRRTWHAEVYSFVLFVELELHVAGLGEFAYNRFCFGTLFAKKPKQRKAG